jgi:RNA polymerase sigma-70 factor (ECF subfamily)
MEDGEMEFQEIYDTFQPKIHRYLAQLVGEGEAEDLTQEVFVKVSRALHTFRGESKLSTWLYRIATNAARDRLRSPSFQRIVQDGLSNASAENLGTELEDRNAWTGEKAPLTEQQVFRKEMNKCIQEHIAKLPENHRTVLVLSEFEGLKNEDIAEVVGASLDTVKIRLHRARARLKEELADSCDSYWIEDNEFVPELKRAKK